MHKVCHTRLEDGDPKLKCDADTCISAKAQACGVEGVWAYSSIC